MCVRAQALASGKPVLMGATGPRLTAAEELFVKLEQVPAFKLEKRKTLDSIFPNFSKAVMTQSNLGFTMGLSCEGQHPNRIDGCFLSLLKGRHDFLYAPMPFVSVEELFIVAEKSVKSFNQKKTALLKKYREDWITWIMHPRVMSVDEEKSVLQLHRTEAMDPFENYGPVKSYCRLSENEACAPPNGFSFQSIVPKSNQQLTSGKFRWISYRHEVLRVCVGRSAGGGRECDREHVLQEWRRKFTSFHEMMCAVEASWMRNGEYIGDSMLAEDTEDEEWRMQTGRLWGKRAVQAAAQTVHPPTEVAKKAAAAKTKQPRKPPISPLQIRKNDHASKYVPVSALVYHTTKSQQGSTAGTRTGSFDHG
jgi:hypothetical protein